MANLLPHVQVAKMSAEDVALDSATLSRDDHSTVHDNGGQETSTSPPSTLGRRQRESHDRVDWSGRAKARIIQFAGELVAQYNIPLDKREGFINDCLVSYL